MRLAWFTPWTPQPSGVAGVSAELVPALAEQGHGVDLFVDERFVTCRPGDDAPPEPGRVRIQSAHQYVWRAERHQYDLAVYQAGNSAAHDFIWPYLFRWPGLTVLHDARLHHARGYALLSRCDAETFRAEFAWNHPRAHPRGAELGVSGLNGPYYYLWPMVRRVIAASKRVAAHSRGTLALLADEHAGTPLDYIALSSGRDMLTRAGERPAMRARFGAGPDTVLFGVFGGLTPEKRILSILRAFASVVRRHPHVRLLFAGGASTELNLPALVQEFGLTTSVTIEHGLSDEEFDAAVSAADVTLHLRWPTALEMSGPWLRALAAARPTVILDLVHMTPVPALDPQTWQSRNPESPVAPVTIALDILDEVHSLQLAMVRLASDRVLRVSLGRAARAYWEREHHPDRMRDDYLRSIEQAAVMPPPAPAGPTLTIDPLSHARALLAPFDQVPCASR